MKFCHDNVLKSGLTFFPRSLSAENLSDEIIVANVQAIIFEAHFEMLEKFMSQQYCYLCHPRGLWY